MKNLPKKPAIIALLSLTLLHSVQGEVWCYNCMSHEPGCDDDNFNWRMHQAQTCATTCVKIIDMRGAERVVTRDCLSNIQGVRTDIPADTFEGCRDAAPHPKLAVDVSNSITEYDLRKTYYTQTKYCFCNLDHWCNASERLQLRSSLVLFLTTAVLLFTAYM